MSSSKKAVVYRVRGLPPDCTSAQLTEALYPLLTTEEKEYFSPRILIVPSCYHGENTATAFMAIETPLQFLSELNKDPLKDWQVEVELDTDDINLDQHFHGFTQLYPTHGESITAEYDSIFC